MQPIHATLATLAVVRSGWMILDCIGFDVDDYPAAKSLFVAALLPLNFSITRESEHWVMIGRFGDGQLWLDSLGATHRPVHVVLAAQDTEQIQAFFEAALFCGAGGLDEPKQRGRGGHRHFSASVTMPGHHILEARFLLDGRDQDVP